MAFHPTQRLTALDVEEVLATVEPGIRRLLARRGLGEGAEDGSQVDAWADEAPVLAGLAAASVQGTVARGSQLGARPRRLGDRREEEELPTPAGCHARANGFDLHAGLVVPAGERDRLERVCRYVFRPPVAQERIYLTDEGQVRVQLRQPWRDGTTDVVFEPVAFLARLAVLVPRPRINLILYYGVLGPRATWRAEVVRLPGANALAYFSSLNTVCTLAWSRSIIAAFASSLAPIWNPTGAFQLRTVSATDLPAAFAVRMSATN